MTTARELMTPGAECVGENETLVDAARKMADLDVGALPICGEDNRLKGIITDRDIVVHCLAKGGDPATALAGQFGQGKPVTIGADDSITEALRTMAEHQIRRLPVTTWSACWPKPTSPARCPSARPATSSKTSPNPEPPPAGP